MIIPLLIIIAKPPILCHSVVDRWFCGPCCFVAAGHPWGDAAFWLRSKPWTPAFACGAVSRKRPAVSPPQPAFAPAAPRLRACGPPPDAFLGRTSPSRPAVRRLLPSATNRRPPPAAPQPPARSHPPSRTPHGRSVCGTPENDSLSDDAHQSREQTLLFC